MPAERVAVYTQTGTLTRPAVKVPVRSVRGHQRDASVREQRRGLRPASPCARRGAVTSTSPCSGLRRSVTPTTRAA
jgi:hypothetical protein